MLLEARKIAPLERAYARYGRWLLRRAFARVCVGGAPWPESGAVIAVPNHSAWWDPVLTLYLSHDLFRRDGYGIMEGAQLVRFPFFRRVGCFGVTTDSREDTRALAQHAATLLRGGPPGPPRMLWIFPQGRLLPATAPLVFRSGAARLARVAPGASILPVAIRYLFRTEQRPEIYVRLGAPVSAAERPPHLTRLLEATLRAELARLDADLALEEPPGYVTVLSGRGSLSALYDRTFGRVRGRDRAGNAKREPPDHAGAPASLLTPPRPLR